MPANCHYDRLLEGDRWARSTWTPLSLNTWRTVTEAICRTQRRNSSAQRVKGSCCTAQHSMANGSWYGVVQAELEPTRCDAPPPAPTRTRTSRSPLLTSPPLECRCCRLGAPNAPDVRWPPLPLLLACAGGMERRREGAWRSKPSCGRCPCKGPTHNTQHMCSDGHAITKDDHTPVCATPIEGGRHEPRCVGAATVDAWGTT